MHQLRTVKEAAAHLRVTTRTIYELLTLGYLDHYKVGAKRGHVRIPQKALDDYLEQRAVRASPRTVSERRRERLPSAAFPEMPGFQWPVGQTS